MRMPVAVEDYRTNPLAPVRYYLAYDQGGSLRAVADASGVIVKKVEYDAFGNVLSDSNTALEFPLGFAGGFVDHHTGLIRFGYRDYDAEIGRWTTKDPIGLLGGDTNLYAYALGDPVLLYDPDGRIIPFLVAGAVAVWGIAEVALSAYDAYDTASTLVDPCASTSEKFLTVGLFVGGLAGPGGGYNSVRKVGIEVVDTAVDASKAAKTLQRVSWADGIQNYRTGAMTAAEHVFYRHGPNSGFANVSKFSQGTRLQNVRNMADEAFTFGTRQGSTITYDAGKVIGTNVSGQATTSVRMHLDSAGALRTIYPI